METVFELTFVGTLAEVTVEGRQGLLKRRPIKDLSNFLLVGSGLSNLLASLGQYTNFGGSLSCLMALKVASP